MRGCKPESRCTRTAEQPTLFSCCQAQPRLVSTSSDRSPIDRHFFPSSFSSSLVRVDALKGCLRPSAFRRCVRACVSGADAGRTRNRSASARPALVRCLFPPAPLASGHMLRPRPGVRPFDPAYPRSPWSVWSVLPNTPRPFLFLRACGPAVSSDGLRMPALAQASSAICNGHLALQRLYTSEIASERCGAVILATVNRSAAGCSV